MTSYHPEDIKQGYCGNCHWWTGRDDLNDALEELTWFQPSLKAVFWMNNKYEKYLNWKDKRRGKSKP